MLQQDTAEDFVIATGIHNSVCESTTFAARTLNIKLVWRGNGVEETAVDQNGNTVVVVDPRYFRPAEVETLLSDPSYAHERLGRKPTVKLEGLVKEMVEGDLVAAERDQLVKDHGYGAHEYHE